MDEHTIAKKIVSLVGKFLRENHNDDLTYVEDIELECEIMSLLMECKVYED